MLYAHEIYRWLIGNKVTNACDAFDSHVLASMLALAVEDHQRGVAFGTSLGLSPHAMAELFGDAFPHAKPIVDAAVGEPPVEVKPDEVMLRDLLFRNSTNRSPLQARLAIVIARRTLSPHHLWQDLGLRSRRDLSWLMARHFEPLATRKAQDMKWKKFLYRTICRDADYGLCVAPSCDECDDHEGCFGDEAGPSLLAPTHQPGDAP